jgi:hypothetical protein
MANLSARDFYNTLNDNQQTVLRRLIKFHGKELMKTKIEEDNNKFLDIINDYVEKNWNPYVLPKETVCSNCEVKKTRWKCWKCND